MATLDFHPLLLGSFRFDPAGPILRNGSGQVVSLRPQSIRVLTELARFHGQVISRETIIDAVWPGIAVTDDSLVQCIKDIRAALADRERRIVKTVVGQGYTLIARRAEENTFGRPKIYIEPFAANNEVASDLTQTLCEELLIRLTPRSGISVVCDARHGDDARYVVGGRASIRGGHARIFWQIYRNDNGEEVCAGTAEASEAQIWGLPDRIADKIASFLRVHMAESEGSEFAERDNAELSLQELMTKAAWHMCRFRRENWFAARAALEAAKGLAPDHPVILAMLASMATQMIPLIPFTELPDDVDDAMRLAERAVDLGPSIDYVLRTRGNLRLWRLGDHSGARLDCARALELNPVFHLAHLTTATSEVLSGEFQPGARRLNEMMLRAPPDLQNPLYFSLVALAQLLDGCVPEAIAAAREGFERNPLSSWNALVYAVAVADVPKIIDTEDFRTMLARIDLPAEHFLSMPFTESRWPRFLVERAKAAGIKG